MVRFALLLVLLLTSSSVSFAQLGESTGIYEFKKFESHPIQSALVIVDTDGGTGSGFIIGKDLILTANHCIRGSRDIRIKIPRLSFVSEVVKVVRSDSSNDLALLKVKLPKGLRILSIAKTPPKQGDDVEFLGFAGFSIPRHFDSKVLHIKGDQYLLGAAVIQGDSGGAILNKDGDVVGIIQTGMVQIQSMPTEFEGALMRPLMLGLTSGHTSEAISKFLANTDDKTAAN